MVLLQFEQHVRQFLLGVAPYLIDQPGQYVLTNNEAKIVLNTGYKFNFPVLAGQSPAEVTGPCLIAFANEATQQGCTLNHEAAIEVELRWPADAETFLGTREDLLCSFTYAAGQLQQALYKHDLAERITSSISPDEFTCFDVRPDRVQQSEFSGRLRIYRIRFRAVVASFFIPLTTPCVPYTAAAIVGPTVIPQGGSITLTVTATGGPTHTTTWVHNGGAGTGGGVGPELVVTLPGIYQAQLESLCDETETDTHTVSLP